MTDHEGYYIVPGADKYYHVKKDSDGNYEFKEHISIGIPIFNKWNPIKLGSLHFESDDILLDDNPHIKLRIIIPLTWKLNISNEEKMKFIGYHINGHEVIYIKYSGNDNLYDIYTVQTNLSGILKHTLTVIPLATRIVMSNNNWGCDIPKSSIIPTKEELRKYLKYDEKSFGHS
jgi:hypothetical protein